MVFLKLEKCYNKLNKYSLCFVDCGPLLRAGAVLEVAHDERWNKCERNEGRREK